MLSSLTVQEVWYWYPEKTLGSLNAFF